MTLVAAGLPLTAEESADATETIKRQTKASGNNRLTVRFPCYRCPTIEFPLSSHSEFRPAFFRQIYADGVREKAHATLAWCLNDHTQRWLLFGIFAAPVEGGPQGVGTALELRYWDADGVTSETPYLGQ